MEYVTAREFENRMSNLDRKVDRVESKVDRLLGQRAYIVKKTAIHVSWLTPLIIALIEAVKALLK